MFSAGMTCSADCADPGRQFRDCQATEMTEGCPDLPLEQVERGADIGFAVGGEPIGDDAAAIVGDVEAAGVKRTLCVADAGDAFDNAWQWEPS
jgi:hypothetical protein